MPPRRHREDDRRHYPQARRPAARHGNQLVRRWVGRDMDSKVSSDVSDNWPIEPVDPSLVPQLRTRIDGKAKPLGALGRLEDLAVQLGQIWHPLPPRTKRATMFVFAADHGITAEGVSAYPASVTAAMV